MTAASGRGRRGNPSNKSKRNMAKTATKVSKGKQPSAKNRTLGEIIKASWLGNA